MDGLKNCAVVIPAYNESATIVRLVQQCLEHTPHVIVVDDGSQDGTADLLVDCPVTLVRHKENRGKGESLIAGFQAALRQGADWIITLDGDGQHRPEDIPSFLDAALQHPSHIIIGSRAHDRAAFPLARYRANRFADFWISWASGCPTMDSQSGFRLYPRSVVEKVLSQNDNVGGFVFESEVLIRAAWAGHNNLAIPIPALYSGTMQRESHFRPVADITKIVLMVAGKLLSRWMYPEGLVRVLRAK
ncbi:MAG: glycosyltransferase family 2 protein [Pseudomonadota bacterium]